MIKHAKNLIFILFILAALIGCNSEKVVSPPIDSTFFEITVMPSLVPLIKGRTQQLVATVTYSDGSEADVSKLVTWEIVGDPTIADISASGLVTGKAKGRTLLTASMDGITSNTVEISVCDLAGPCLDILDTGHGKLITNSPSVVYLDSIGGSATDTIFTETGTLGPVGNFYRFNLNNANALCDTYNTLILDGRDNWRLATRRELKDLVLAYGNMFNSHGWPSYHYYWSATPFGASDGYYVGIDDGFINNTYVSYPLYASCVSEP